VGEPAVEDDPERSLGVGRKRDPIVAIDQRIDRRQKLPCGNALNFVAQIIGAVRQQREFLAHRRSPPLRSALSRR